MWIDEFVRAIEAAGLHAPKHIYADGKLHRFNGSGRRGDLAAWYVLYSDGIPAGRFGCWRAGFSEPWSATRGVHLSAQEFSDMRKRMEIDKLLRDQSLASRRKNARQKALERWVKALPTVQHPYTTAKGVQPHFLRTEANGTLLVPIRDISGVLHSLQSITHDGRKRFQADGRVQGCFHAIGTPERQLVVCEGIATASSIFECTNLAVAAAFSASNLLSVARALRQRHPEIQLLIAADDDHVTEGNPGMTNARSTALSVGGTVVTPQFPSNRPRQATDFNDLHSTAGASAVRTCFAEILEN